MKRYLIFGASGTVGSSIVQLLTNQGHNIRAATSRQAREDRNIEWVHVDLIKGEGIQEAFEGVQGAFLMSPPGHADQYRVLSPLIQEAKKRKLEKVVLMTAMGANAVETAPFRRAEIELEKSGIPYTILRPNWFMQNFNTFWLGGILEQSKILLPAGTAQVSFIDARDIAEVAVRCLVSHQFDQRAFDLTGGEAVDHATVASRISGVAGRKVGYENIDPQMLKAGLLKAGLPADYSEFMLMIFGFLKEGYNARTTDDVRLILGRSPISLNQYVQDYRTSWAK